MHGIGNDYIYIDCFNQSVPEDLSTLSINLSDRHRGIGADGLVLIYPSEQAHCRMQVFNSDGSEGMMCGNAIRCVGKYIYENNITSDTEITVETQSGIKHLSLNVEAGMVTKVKVDMGKANFDPQSIPMLCDKSTFIGKEIATGNTTYRSATAVSMGNPHLVINYKDVNNLDLTKLGPLLENHKLFPERTNVEFAELIAPNTIRMRVWERGSGETLACGTGACAVAVTFSELGIVDRTQPITIELSGGSLTITYQEDGTVLKEGTATEVFRGIIK